MKEKVYDKEKKEPNKRVITVAINTSTPSLDLLVDTVDKFMTKFLDTLPKTYYVKLEIGNDHPSMITIPVVKVFRGNGPPIKLE